MDVRRMMISTPCPACGERKLLYTAAQIDVPYFGRMVETLLLCAHCGFKHADVVSGRTNEPTRVTFSASGPEAMMVRVVRSTSGTVRIPELGVVIEPGPSSDAYVSNIEGVLNRVAAVVGHLMRDAETDEARQAAVDRLAQIEEAREGRLPFTLIIEDPYGNSAIGHESARVESIPPEEAERLAKGEVTFDVQNLPDPKDALGAN
jgi:zinc finger protein